MNKRDMNTIVDLMAKAHGEVRSTNYPIEGDVTTYQFMDALAKLALSIMEEIEMKEAV